MAKPQNAIVPSRSEDFPEWYQQVVRASDLAENSEVRGCMVIKPCLLYTSDAADE